jgi:polyphosphate kinase 2
METAMAKNKAKHEEERAGGEVEDKKAKKDKQQAEKGEIRGPLKRKAYEKELKRLQAELCKLQEWVKYKGLRVIVVFEGRDAAGKGGTIKAITERVSPRVFRQVALPAPSDREKSQMYIQRYMAHFPAAGEIVIFDRSWYNRAGVEYVMGFCTKQQHDRFLELAPEIEKYIAEAGIILVKFWLEVSNEQQKKRFEARRRHHDPQGQHLLALPLPRGQHDPLAARGHHPGVPATAGYPDVSCVQNKTVVTNAFKGEDLNNYVPLFKKYDIPVLYNFKEEDMKWVVYKPKARRCTSSTRSSPTASRSPTTSSARTSSTCRR